MKSILAVRQRKKSISPWGVNCHKAEWNWFLPWGKEKIDYRREAWIAVRRNEIDSCREAKKKIDYRREAWITVRRMKSIFAVRQRKNRYRREAWIAFRRKEIGFCREAKKKSISPLGVNLRQAERNWFFAVRQRRNQYPRETWIAVRRKEIDSCHEAKKKSISPWGVNRHKVERNRFLPWGKEKSISPLGVNCRQAERNQFLPWGKEKIDIAVRRESPSGGKKSIFAVRQRKNWYRRGNCLFYACISKLQNCSTFTIEKASTNTRNYFLDYLLLHGSHFHPLCHATNHSLMPILLFKVCALLIKFARDFFS